MPYFASASPTLHMPTTITPLAISWSGLELVSHCHLYVNKLNSYDPHIHSREFLKTLTDATITTSAHERLWFLCYDF